MFWLDYGQHSLSVCALHVSVCALYLLRVAKSRATRSVNRPGWPVCLYVCCVCPGSQSHSPEGMEPSWRPQEAVVLLPSAAV